MGFNELREIVFAKGHRNILATHPTTLEFTTENVLSRKGDCIVAVSADRAMPDLNAKFKEKLCRDDAKLTILIEAVGETETVCAYGRHDLSFEDPVEMVVRKSTYVCGRTLAVKADKAAVNLSRAFVEKLQSPARKVKITLTVDIVDGYQMLSKTRSQFVKDMPKTHF